MADRRTLILRSDRISKSDASEARFEAIPWGEDCAKFIWNDTLQTSSSPAMGPEADEDGWIFTVKKQEEVYSIKVHWLPREKEENWWACHITAHGGLLSVFNRKKASTAFFEELCERVEQSVRAHASPVEMKWISDEEFNSI
jgi:hypothetical protein